MKTKLFFLLTLVSQFIFSQCPEGNVTFTSQTTINDFVAQYPNCTQISGNLTFNGFGMLNLTGLSNLTSVTGELFLNIMTTSNINASGLQNITTIGGQLRVFSLGNLTNLDFLSGLTSVGGIEIGNNILTNIQGLSNISGPVTEGIRIDQCNSLTSLNGLHNITSVGGFITVINNTSLTDLTGLEGITSADMNIQGGMYNVWIFNNTNLSSLNGLHNLTTLTASANNASTGFDLTNNPSLTNISALSNISGISDRIFITNNSQLTTCAINPVCNKLAANTTNVNISGNAAGCESVTAVENACALSSDLFDASNVSIYPVPFQDSISIQFGAHVSGLIRIVDLTGKVLISTTINGQNKEITSLGHLAKGMYILQVTSKDGDVYTQKIVK